MRIFISGVTGYVGRNLAKHLINSHQVVGLSRCPDKSPFIEELEELGIKVFKGSLHARVLATYLTGCDLVIHVAADTDHKNISISQFETNVSGTKLLLHAAKSAGVKKFIHISTDSVILTGKAIRFANERQPFPRVAVGHYSESKRLAEEVVLEAKSNDFDVMILRPRFVWGRDDTTAMPQILRAIADNQFAWINGGNYETSTLHIGNLCSAVECTIKRGVSGEVYFISDDDDRSFREIVSSLAEAHGCLVPDRSIPRFVPLLIAKLDNFRRIVLPRSKPLPITMQEYSTSAVEVTLDIRKAKKMLGYKPVISFHEGLDEIRNR
ncbi:NAD-dependent epimerase/dehydratase family protein [Vibrio vulnificus]|uniref:NAD-dependent epimerase/dehydratase family protein n=1 Tax=Vibrio vulnificus TaxID=672 RepID=UPI000697D0A1|nr:NAD-dependent epimerase/dehydratase family protein [Vibrio vulnificus]MBN8089132.1 NAD-dependent epimerase/dehydratase family protein [Vibrio vulnificus]MBN8118058.1 NAD-dependent epimerase/dehydratase family protein [Vibrio vulnificus]